MKKIFFMCVAALAMLTVSCSHHHGHKKGHHSHAECKDGQCPVNKKGEKDCCGMNAKKVWFVEPIDGATVGQKFAVKFGVKGMDIQPAGQMKEMTGHHHLLVNATDIDPGAVIPADEKHIHFGKGQTETTLELPPGKHELTLQFADGAHMSYGDEMRAKITVNVK